MAADPTPDPALVDAVARRVIELLDGTAEQAAGELLTVAEIASRYRVKRSWVYEHQRELGVIRLGDGPKPRLRFDAAVVASTLQRRPGAPRRRDEDHPRRPRRRRRLPARMPPPLP